ncbi:MAG: hypothetical protein HC890_18160 [Chloroflexaceae bacterium]|nr:hypothetical protein [Chloroflexaceae bacterium]
MSQCPVCNSHYRPGDIAHCATCGWNLAALPATLGQIPQAFQSRDLEKLDWAQKTWTQLQTQSQQLSQLQQERSHLQAQLSQKAQKLTASPEILSQLRSQLKESAREKRQLQEQLATTVRLFRQQQQTLAAQLQKSKEQLAQSKNDKATQQTLSSQNFAISLSLNEQEAPAEVVVIHEFSTGIYGSRAADGTWQFHGLTGHYMNSTLELIPACVQQAIGNGYFSIAGGSEEKPALVGRVINSAKDGFWSVLAVVTERKHSNGEVFSAYRYFLSQGKDKLVQILNWMSRHKQKFGLHPTFNPSDPKKPGQQQRFESKSRFVLDFPSETQAWLDNVGTPLIIVEPIYTVEAIDRLATWLVERRRLMTQRPPQTEAWVYNADSVERIETFWWFNSLIGKNSRPSKDNFWGCEKV